MTAAAHKAISFFTSFLTFSSLMSSSKYSTSHKVSEIDIIQTHLQEILAQKEISASTLM